MADISFKNADGSARNTPRVLDAPEGTDEKVGEVVNPEEVVDVTLLAQVEHAVADAVEHALHPLTPEDPAA